MESYNNTKRLILFAVSSLMTLWSFAQSQYDYYEGKDAYGGVDTAIRGLKFFGILFLIIAAIVIVGGLWAKFMDFVNPPKQNPPQNKPLQKDIRPNNDSRPVETEQKIIEPEREVVITIDGKTVQAYVTLIDGSKTKWPETYWYEINSITYNLTQDITHCHGDDIVQSVGTVYKGSHINREDVMLDTVKECHRNNLLTIRGKFDPKKLQMIRIDRFGFYDFEVYCYNKNGKWQSGEYSDKEAESIVQNVK